MTSKRPLSVIVTPLLLFWVASSSQAAIYVPPGLNPGDTYHLAFVTRDTRDALSPFIADYNSFVQAQAALNPTLTGTDMGVIWKAIASTSSVNARDNALVAAPVYSLDGTKIADGFSDMWDGNIDSLIYLTQFAAPVGPAPVYTTPFVWTGTAGDGSAYLPLGSPPPYNNVGLAHAANLQWIRASLAPPSDVLFLYALSPMQIVPAIPEPSSFVLCLGVASVLGLVGGYRRWTA